MQARDKLEAGVRWPDANMYAWNEKGERCQEKHHIPPLLPRLNSESLGTWDSGKNALGRAF